MIVPPPTDAQPSGANPGPPDLAHPTIHSLKRPAVSRPSSPQHVTIRRKSVDLIQPIPCSAPPPFHRSPQPRMGAKSIPTLRLPPLSLSLPPSDSAPAALRGRSLVETEAVPAPFSQPLPANQSSSFPSTSKSYMPTPPITTAPLVLSGEPAHASTLASRRALKNRKNLSLVVPTPSDSPSIATAAHLAPDAETRSLPPSPISLVAFIGVEGSELEDKTIGRLMMKQQTDELKEQMKGGRGMHRRTSIPRLNLSGTGGRPPSTSGRGFAGGDPSKGSAVRLIRRNGVERIDELTMDVDEVAEEFPYEHGPREILPGVWLGSEQNARDPKILQKFGWVLNVAKEVECPWTDEIIEEVEEEEDEMEEEELDTSTIQALPRSKSWKDPTTKEAEAISSVPHRLRHRRNKTQSVIPLPATNPSALLVRAVASTPNLQSAFVAGSPSPEKRLRSPCQSPLSPAIAQSTSALAPIAASPLSAKKPVAPTVHFPANTKTGRPALEYLWLKWGHDEADLVESESDREQGLEGGKLAAAFDFIDTARASKNGNILIHCQCGVSRSATVLIAYCMREASRALENSELKGITSMHEAYSFVKERSEWVGPNLCLVFQLVAFERSLRGTPAHAEEELGYPYQNPHAIGESEDATSATSSSPPSEVDPLSPSFSVTSKSTATTESRSILAKRSTDTIAEAEECLSPMAEALKLSESQKPLRVPSSSAPASTQPTTPASLSSVFGLPRNNSSTRVPLPQTVTAPPPTPLPEITSPAPTRMSFRSQVNASLSGVGSGASASFSSSMRRFGYPKQPKSALLASNRTVFSRGDSTAPVSLARGLSSSSSPPNTYTEDELEKRKVAHKRAFSTAELLPVLLKRS